MQLLDPRFKKNPRPYFVQTALALATFVVLLLFVETVTQAVIVAALGASTVIVFSMPNTITARPRRLIGGHLVGLASGSACHFIFSDQLAVRLINDTTMLTAVTFAAAIAIAMFLMAVTNTEHPPAAATSIGLLTAGWSVSTILAVIIFAILLSVVHHALRRYLVDLF